MSHDRDIPLNIPIPPLWTYPPPSGHTHALLVKSCGHQRRPVQTCSLEDLPTLTPVYYITSSGGHQNGWYATYWNAFLSIYFAEKKYTSYSRAPSHTFVGNKSW